MFYSCESRDSSVESIIACSYQTECVSNILSKRFPCNCLCGLGCSAPDRWPGFDSCLSQPFSSHDDVFRYYSGINVPFCCFSIFNKGSLGKNLFLSLVPRWKLCVHVSWEIIPQSTHFRIPKNTNFNVTAYFRYFTQNYDFAPFPSILCRSKVSREILKSTQQSSECWD